MRMLKPILLVLSGMLVGSILYAFAPELIRTADDEPPANLVVVSKRLHTAGQPTAAQLAGLGDRGYDLVLNLAPPEVFGSLQNEGGIVGQTGLRYINIPVDWHRPKVEDFRFFSSVLQQPAHRQILVHCQINKRASLFTFLYRVVHERADPDEAYENVTAIWVPDPHWVEFANRILTQHGIEFEL